MGTEIAHSKKKKVTPIIKKEESKLKDEYKIVFIGGNRIGTKSSLINILAGEKFNPDIESGKLAASDKDINIDIEQNKKITFNLWDIPDQESFRPVLKLFFNNVDCAIIGYDINNKKNFEEAKNFWYPTAKQIDECELIYLIGNKIDLNERREVDKEEANEFAKSENLRFFEISCKTGEGIKEFMDDLILNLLQ